MRVFVYEYLTAMGLGHGPADPLHSLYREGRAMRDALVDDLLRVPGWGAEILRPTVDPPRDHEQQVAQLAERCDWTVVIAPESDGQLERICQAVWSSAGQLLGPSPEAIRLTSDKLAMASHWRDHGIATPATTDREPTRCEAFPIVWKPRDGAGSAATFFVPTPTHVAWARAKRDAEGHTGPMILQEFARGRAVSVAFLCGPRGHVPLLPASQELSEDGRFHYRGGELPLPPDLAARATRLARRAVECVPGLRGYLGVDLVLGEAADGSRDFAIEINPRLTTSYVGLRALSEVNLAEAMVTIGAGESLREIRWKPERARFGADGAVQVVALTN